MNKIEGIKMCHDNIMKFDYLQKYCKNPYPLAIVFPLHVLFKLVVARDAKDFIHGVLAT
jgi:type IV secretory pathway VirB3-like protein